MASQRGEGRLKWMRNIINGQAEVQDVIYRSPGPEGKEEGLVMLPDLNWDRKSVEGLHLLALVQRDDIWSLRDLKKKHMGWLKRIEDEISRASPAKYSDLEEDQLKLYVHYQLTYFHFHVHVVHVALEAGATQATGKAIELRNIISQLETMHGNNDTGMETATLTYTIGEEDDLWSKVFKPLKDADRSQRS